MTITEFALIVTSLLGVGGWLLNARKNKPEIKVMGSQEAANLAVALKNAADTVAVLFNSAALTDKEKRDADARNEELEKRIKELETRNDTRDREITEEQLQRLARDSKIAELESQMAADLKETQTLRDEVRALRKQVAEGEIKYQDIAQKYNEVAQKYNDLKAYTQKLLMALREAGVEKLPDINGDLPDSIKGWRWDDPK
jgi:chromosome segregation ATPase